MRTVNGWFQEWNLKGPWKPWRGPGLLKGRILSRSNRQNSKIPAVTLRPQLCPQLRQCTGHPRHEWRSSAAGLKGRLLRITSAHTNLTRPLRRAASQRIIVQKGLTVTDNSYCLPQAEEPVRAEWLPPTAARSLKASDT